VTDLSQLVLKNSTDPYLRAKERGWQITDASALSAPLALEADVVIVGSGAGGGTAAETLAKSGLSVVILEAGPLLSSSDFTLEERQAYRDLYQEGTGRATKDAAIGILQGRSVGGSTTVNWTSSFRTPNETLAYWADHMGVQGCSAEEMAPYFDEMAERLGIAEWEMLANPNNELLARAADKLGFSWKRIPRNVRGCLNLGYCGFGCPVDAKQSMLVTTIPGALDHKAHLVHRAQVERLIIEGNRVAGVEAVALDPRARKPIGQPITVRGRVTVLCGGGIQNPGILLRSKAADPHARIGKRTFLHPTVLAYGVFADVVDPYYGAPQSIYSDHFQWQQVSDGPMGFKLEVPPLHPAFAAGFSALSGEELAEGMRELPNTHAMIALMRDGFHEQSQGGSVELDKLERPILDYPLTDYFFEGARRALSTMLEMQFAVGAKKARPSHRSAPYYGSWQEAKKAVSELSFAPGRLTVGSAHVMGGCAMGEDPKRSVTDSYGKFHQMDDLYVMDGSLFPSSIGANPQLSIYGLTLRNARQLAEGLQV
jgi:choline dehydrogenase-like flavoprotein